MDWRRDTLASIDALLDTNEAFDRKQLRADIWRLVCDQTGVFVEQYRADIFNPDSRLYKCHLDH